MYTRFFNSFFLFMQCVLCASYYTLCFYLTAAQQVALLGSHRMTAGLSKQQYNNTIMKITVSCSFTKNLLSLMFLCPSSSPESSVVACFWCLYTSMRGRGGSNVLTNRSQTHTKNTHIQSCIPHIPYIIGTHIPGLSPVPRKNMNANNVSLSLSGSAFT